MVSLIQNAVSVIDYIRFAEENNGLRSDLLRNEYCADVFAPARIALKWRRRQFVADSVARSDIIGVGAAYSRLSAFISQIADAAAHPEMARVFPFFFGGGSAGPCDALLAAVIEYAVRLPTSLTADGTTDAETAPLANLFTARAPAIVAAARRLVQRHFTDAPVSDGAAIVLTIPPPPPLPMRRR